MQIEIKGIDKHCSSTYCSANKEKKNKNYKTTCTEAQEKTSASFLADILNQLVTSKLEAVFQFLTRSD